MRIAAVIVTFNRENKIEKAITSLFNNEREPDMVIVINNNSTDGTAQILKRISSDNEKVKIFNTNTNVGGSGGFCIGIKKAYELKATHIWIMDDDSYADEFSLSYLVDSYNKLDAIHKLGFVCSRVDWTDGGICEMNQPVTSWNWMRLFSKDLPVVQVESCSFVSCFFSKEIVEELGLPLFDFFIWFDDVEFTKRISNHYPCFAIMNSRVTHDIPKNEGVFFSSINDNNLWKYKFGAINESWYRFKKESPLHWFIFLIKKNIEMIKGRVRAIHIFLINIGFIKGVLKKHKILTINELETNGMLKEKNL